MARILIVEDNEINRDMLGRRLSRNGHDVVYAIDGASAIATAELECPDLILMDIGLGNDNGLEVTQQIRAQSFGRDVPIIALTAHVMASDRDACLAVGCNDFEIKPVEFGRLLKKIDNYLGAAVSQR